MRDKHDHQTMNITDLPKPRGRPSTGNAMTAAERQRKFRERNNLKSFTVSINAETWAALEAYQLGKNVSKSAIVEKLLRTQLLRKR